MSSRTGACSGLTVICPVSALCKPVARVETMESGFDPAEGGNPDFAWSRADAGVGVSEVVRLRRGLCESR